jgi:hypothetical protein
MTSDASPTAVPGVTRNVEPATLKALLANPPRATVAFVERGEATVVPVRARCRTDSYRFGVRPEMAPGLENREVVLLMDDGAYWFELRGLSVRGVAKRIEHLDPGETSALAWYAVEPRRILAWDYGRLREG